MTLSTCGFFQSSFFAGKNSLKIILKYYFYYNNIFKMSKCFLPYLIYMIHPLCVISFCSFFFRQVCFLPLPSSKLKITPLSSPVFWPPFHPLPNQKEKTMAAIIRIKENFPWSLLLERWRSKYGDYVHLYGHGVEFFFRFRCKASFSSSQAQAKIWWPGAEL